MAFRGGSTNAFWALLCSSVALTIAQTPNDQCFWKANGTVIPEGPAGWYACNNTATTANGASLCCLKDSECGEDSICHFPGGSVGGSGWFVGGCTDGSYNDPVCPRACTGDALTYIQYNNTEQLWHCCGDDGCTGTPTRESFQAVAPDQWSALPSTATSASSSSSTSTSTATAGSSITNNNNGINNNDGNSSSGLSTGAQAGIGIGVGLGGAIILAAVLFVLLRRRSKAKKSSRNDAEAEQMMRNRSKSNEAATAQAGQYQDFAAAPAYPGSSQPPVQDLKQPTELPMQQSARPSELGAGIAEPQELPNTQVSASELPGDERHV